MNQALKILLFFKVFILRRAKVLSREICQPSPWSVQSVVFHCPLGKVVGHTAQMGTGSCPTPISPPAACWSRS